MVAQVVFWGGDDARYDVSVSYNLSDWSPYGSVTGSHQYILMNDTNLAGSAKRFYKIEAQPAQE